VVRSLLASLGGISGGKFYILGVAGYNTPIWDVLALQGEQEEAGEHLHGAKFVELSQLGKRCQLVLLGLGFCSWARWARFFIEKKVYCNRYSIYTYNLPFFKCLGMQEWVDGVE